MQRALSLEAETSLRPTMEAEGATFTETDRAAFVAATASVYDAYARDFPELVGALREAAGQ